MNNKYDTNHYAAIVKELESPEDNLDAFNARNKLQECKVHIEKRSSSKQDEDQNEAPGVFQFIKVASVNPEMVASIRSCTQSNYNATHSNIPTQTGSSRYSVFDS